jgi:hypothetical protein
MWDNENVSEYELTKNEEPEQLPIVQYRAIPKDEVQTIQDNSAFDLNEEEVSITYNSRIRLEQAKLYEMLIDQDIFDGVEANPQAIQNVKTELKQYILDRLNILLGMKSEIRQTSQKVELPFNTLEIQFLKDLAFKGTKGESGESNEPAQLEVRNVEEPNRPLNKLKPLMSRPKAEPLATVTAKPVQQLATKNVKTTKAVKTTKTVKETVDKNKLFFAQGKEISEATAEQVAKDEIAQIAGKPFEQISKEELKQIQKQMANPKTFDEMTEAEQQAKIEAMNEKHRRGRPANALPMPSQGEANAIIADQVTRRQQQSSGNEMSQLNNILTQVVLNQR